MTKSDQPAWHLFVIPGSHFDLGWCASPAETFAYGDLIIKEAIDAITGNFPEYKFTVEYAMFLKHFLDTYPQYKKIVRELIHDGKFEVCALWTGMMDQIMDGEAAIRNVVMAKRWAKEQLGVELITAQSSDCPGHTIQLAQILAKCDVQYLAYSRYSAPIPLHKWLSPDGSSIIAANHSVGLYKSLVDAAWAGSGYGWGFILRRSIEDVERILPAHLKDIENIWPAGQPVIMGAESDLIPAYPKIADKIDDWNKRNDEIRLELSTTTQFFKNVKEENLPEYCGEAPYEFHTLGACFPQIFKKAKYAHSMLTAAEKMGSLQELLGLGQANKASLDGAWTDLTIPHDHNVGGRHGEVNDAVRLHCVEKAMITANNVAEEAMLFFMTQIDYPPESGIPVVVFNPLSWERSEAVETYIETGEKNVENLAVFDPSGKQVPAQFLKSEGQNHKRVHFLFLAENMPSIGYKAFYARFPKEVSVNPGQSLNINENTLENQYLRISLENGLINSIFWKQEGVELCQNAEFGEIFVRENTESDIWDNLTGLEWKEKKNRQVEVLESGALRGKLRIKSEILGCSLVKELSLYDNMPWAELSVTIDWAGERNREVLLSLPLNVPEGEITYETPYGHVSMKKDELPGTYRGKGGRYIQKWIDVSNDKMGVCIGTDCISHILNNTDVSPMLIRSAYSCGTPHHWYDNIGKHTFRFSLLPHAGDWVSSKAFRIGWQHTSIMPVGRMNICAPIAPIPGSTFLPQSYSLCKVSPDNVVLTTIKRADDDQDSQENHYIARLVEIGGKGADVSLEFGLNLESAWKTDLMERNLEKLPIEDNKLCFSLSPYEIYTVRFLPESE